MNATRAAQGKHTGETSALYMAFELGEENWKLALSDGERAPSRYTLLPCAFLEGLFETHSFRSPSSNRVLVLSF